jgi:hypothetical protein
MPLRGAVTAVLQTRDMKLHFFPEAADGGAVNTPADKSNVNADPPQGEAAPPPAATVVTEGTRNERELELERELEEERNLRKSREVRVSELEDENHRLKNVTPRPPRKPAKAPLTFFDAEEAE